MATSRVERLANRFRARLLERDSEALREIARAYNGATTNAVAHARAYHAALVAEADRLGVTLAEVSSPPFHPSWALQRDRLARLTRRLTAEMESILPDVVGTISAAQRAAYELGIEHAHDLTRSILESGVPRSLTDVVGGAVSNSWARPPVEAAAELLGVVADGTPFAERVAEYGAEAVGQIRDGLAKSFLLGEGVDLMARRVVGAMRGNSYRAMLISRTESVRAYRFANHESYRANPQVVGGWIWWAELGPRTCGACLDKHGTRHKASETLSDHPNGRCAPIPDVRSYSELAGTLGVPEIADVPDLDYGVGSGAGEAWLSSQPVSVQDSILGKGRGELFRDPTNGIGLSDLVTSSPNRTWGPSIGLKPLREIA